MEVDKPVEEMTVQELLDLVSLARKTSLVQLVDRIQGGGATAADFSALRAAAKDVEEMLGQRAGDRPEEQAERIASQPTEIMPFDETEGYDPNAPLDVH